ncbi:MAG: hypothetical protein Aureis2KO_22190 [Aureisphaera sp.]
MTKYFTLALFFLFGLSIIAQEGIELEIQQAYEAGELDEIITRYGENTEGLSSKALYIVGMTYYAKEDDPNCIKFMNLAIEKDGNNASAHFMKGITLSFSGQFQESITSINKAIELDPTNSEHYSGLGDTYFSLKEFDQALTAYNKAIEQKEPAERAFTMIPQVYAALNKPEEALKAFYQSKNNISKQSQSYIIALYNIGLYEFLKQEYDKAEAAYLELLGLIPEDYPSVSKLIQVYYGKKEYDKAIPLKQKMYEAQEAGLLEGYLEDMFCFDQFNWNGQLVQVFERYEQGDGKLYYKHLFFLVSETNEIELKIQSENSPVAINLNEAKYVLGTDYNGTHYNWGIWFQEDFDYEDMKKAVIYVLDNKAGELLSKK